MGFATHSKPAKPTANAIWQTTSLRYSIVPLLLSLSHSAASQSSVQRIEEVVVSASRLPRTIEKIAGTVTLISANEIEKQLMNDLSDLTRFQPGLSMDTASRGGNEGFNIRGIGGNRVLTVIDGIRSSDIYAAGPSSYGKDSFEVDDFKSVEIIRGPAAVLYGADALGGAVLIQTKGPGDYTGGHEGNFFALRGSAASADEQYKGGFTAGVQRESFSFMTQYTSRQFQDPDVKGPGALNPTDGNSDALLLKASFDISPSQQLTLTVDEYRESNSINLISDLSSSVADSQGQDETSRSRVGIAYSWEGNTVLFDGFNGFAQQQQTQASQQTDQLRLSFSFLNPRQRSTFAGTDAIRATDLQFNQSTRAVGLNFTKSFSGQNQTHTVAYGANFDETETQRPRNRCDTEITSNAVTCRISPFPFAPTENFPNKTFPDSITQRSGVYLQNEIHFDSLGLTLIPGIRYDQYQMDPLPDPLLDSSGIIASFGGFNVESIDESATSISFGAIYEISNSYSAFLQYAEGYRPPNFDESNQAFVNLGLGYATVPNPNLNPESSRGIELGLRANYEQAFFSATVYNNRYRDFIDSQFVGIQNNISLFQDVNIGQAQIRGAELMGALYLSPQWQIRGSLAYAHGDNLDANIALDTVEPLTGVFGLGYDNANNAWGGELMLTVVDSKDRVSSQTLATTEAFQVLDLLSYYRLNDSHNLRFGVFNLLDEQYARWASIRGLEANATANIANSQQPGINFRIGYNYEF